MADQHPLANHGLHSTFLYYADVELVFMLFQEGKSAHFQCNLDASLIRNAHKFGYSIPHTRIWDVQKLGDIVVDVCQTDGDLQTRQAVHWSVQYNTYCHAVQTQLHMYSSCNYPPSPYNSYNSYNSYMQKSILEHAYIKIQAALTVCTMKA